MEIIDGSLKYHIEVEMEKADIAKLSAGERIFVIGANCEEHDPLVEIWMRKEDVEHDG
jgi:hypothetical protein